MNANTPASTTNQPSNAQHHANNQKRGGGKTISAATEITGPWIPFTALPNTGQDFNRASRAENSLQQSQTQVQTAQGGGSKMVGQDHPALTLEPPPHIRDPSLRTSFSNRWMIEQRDAIMQQAAPIQQQQPTHERQPQPQYSRERTLNR